MENMEDIVLEHLRAIRSDVGNIKADITEIKLRLGSIEMSVGSIHRYCNPAQSRRQTGRKG